MVWLKAELMTTLRCDVNGWTCIIILKPGEECIELVWKCGVCQGRGTGGLFVVCEISDALPHSARVVVSEVVLNALVVLFLSIFDASFQGCSGSAISLSVP